MINGETQYVVHVRLETDATKTGIWNYEIYLSCLCRLILVDLLFQLKKGCMSIILRHLSNKIVLRVLSGFAVTFVKFTDYVQYT